MCSLLKRFRSETGQERGDVLYLYGQKYTAVYLFGGGGGKNQTNSVVGKRNGFRTKRRIIITLPIIIVVRINNARLRGYMKQNNCYPTGTERTRCVYNTRFGRDVNRAIYL